MFIRKSLSVANVSSLACHFFEIRQAVKTVIVFQQRRGIVVSADLNVIYSLRTDALHSLFKLNMSNLSS